jgi:hypothetical protein
VATRCTQRECWCLWTILATRAHSIQVHLSLVFVMRCQSVLYLLHIWSVYIVCTADYQLLATSMLLFPQHTVSCCFCTIYFGICISQFADITAVDFAFQIFASSGIGDEINSWGNQVHND